MRKYKVAFMAGLFLFGSITFQSCNRTKTPDSLRSKLQDMHVVWDDTADISPNEIKIGDTVRRTLSSIDYLSRGDIISGKVVNIATTKKGRNIIEFTDGEKTSVCDEIWLEKGTPTFSHKTRAATVRALNWL